MSLLPAMIAAAVTWVGLTILVGNAARLPLDHPNARSLHGHAVPRVGGMAIWAGWLAGTAWLPGPKVWLAPLLALIAISLLDDHRGVHPGLRLAVHIGAAASWVWLAAPAVDPVVAVLVIVWMAVPRMDLFGLKTRKLAQKDRDQQVTLMKAAPLVGKFTPAAVIALP